ncbi:MAG: NAD-binding protein [Nitrososphaerales archaeon]
MKEAGIDRASLVVVSHVNDPDNMLFILSARKLRPDIRINSSSRSSDCRDREKRRGRHL